MDSPPLAGRRTISVLEARKRAGTGTLPLMRDAMAIFISFSLLCDAYASYERDPRREKDSGEAMHPARVSRCDTASP